MTMMELTSMSGSDGRDGIHLSAQLRVDAMQLRSYEIDWAAECMELAANRIDALEDIITNDKPS